MKRILILRNIDPVIGLELKRTEIIENTGVYVGQEKQEERDIKKVIKKS